MDAYYEFIEPTRVSHCIGCNFISPSVKHLIVAKSTLLQVFEIGKDSNLKLVEQFKLHGMITDLKAIRTVENPNLDYVLVSTKFAKMSLIRWNHKFNSISTVSLHYYENSIRNSTFEKLTGTSLIVEPNSYSCTCMRFKNILTFLQFEVDDDEYDDDMDDDDNKKRSRSIQQQHQQQQQSMNQLQLELSTRDAPPLFVDSSFQLDAQTLDPSIGEIIDMQFLYNYREPTLAIIYTNNSTWSGMLPKVKDNISFMVLSLDLMTRSTTAVLKVDNLPFDIERVIPLPQPFNGSLLVGCNELIHIDNGGITRRIAVNQYTESITSTKNYLDQSSLKLQLENCSITPIKNDNRLLLVLEKGEFYFINFKIDGKSIKKVFIEKVDDDKYSDIQLTFPGDIALLDKGLMFMSNKNGDNLLVEIGYTQQEDAAVTEADEDEEIDRSDGDDEGDYIEKLDNSNGINDFNGDFKLVNEDDEDDDNLYGDEDEDSYKKTTKKGIIKFTKCDTLINNGPVSNFTLGHYSTDKFKANLSNPNFKEVSIVGNCGSHNNASINIMVPSIQPIVKSSLSFSQIDRMWTISNKYLITSDDVNFKSEIFQINKSFARLNAKDFINDQSTIAIFEIGENFSIQITSATVNLYDSKFKKLASLDEELGKLLSVNDDNILFGTLSDEYLLITVSTGEAMIFQINTYNASFTKINLPKILEDTIITTGYITNSSLLNSVTKDIGLLIKGGNKRKHSSSISSTNSANGTADGTESTMAKKSKLFVLVTGDNRIVVFNRFHNEKCFQLNDLDKFSNHLKIAFFEKRETLPDPFIKQIVLNPLGNKNNSDCEEFLTILTIGGEIILYKLYFDGGNYQFIKQRDLRITGAPVNAYSAGTVIERRLVYIKNNNGFSGVFITGTVPYWLTKTYQSIPRIFKFTSLSSVSFSAFSDSKGVKNGFIYLDNKKNARICELPLDFSYDNNWPIKKIKVPRGETVKSITYHETSHTFVISTYKEIPYNALDEENKPIVGIDPQKPSATSFKGYIMLLSPYNWSIIDTIELEDNEIGMSVNSMLLDVGLAQKRFKQKKEFIVIGTGKYRMEDLAANGSFKIYEIIDIIPEPGRPETNHKFKEFCKEDTRGAVTSICEISGRFLVTQGQKIIVRDLQDNGTVPVAFLDTSVYVSEAKSFGNLLILGDTLKSIWLAGFDAEPFRMIMLGKDLQSLDVTCADFIVRDEDIYILVADSKNVLHLLQYDPDYPSSSNGQVLLQKSSFNINSNATCMRSIPKNEEINTNLMFDNFQTIGSTIDGSFFVVFPVSESTYRRMYIIQQQVIDKEYHYCGLNPALNRFGDISVTANDTNVKPLLDYEVIKLFASLNEDRRRNLSMKVGSSQYPEIWKDLIEFENVLKNM
ncbi:protein Cft1p [[Candida] railenensis]|uniref:Protein Cft1p n=1 Tax=[Candida] railenensis TaxID=45579 RepID=A0A9P0QWA0_9ASCO|nr:protein Cft1p [[Candida] railenensis]